MVYERISNGLYCMSLSLLRLYAQCLLGNRRTRVHMCPLFPSLTHKHFSHKPTVPTKHTHTHTHPNVLIQPTYHKPFWRRHLHWVVPASRNDLLTCSQWAFVRFSRHGYAVGISRQSVAGQAAVCIYIYIYIYIYICM
jgi:hypothetical protein